MQLQMLVFFPVLCYVFLVFTAQQEEEIMGKGLRPDFFFKNVYAITPIFLKSHGIKGVILDIDNTLVFYGVHRPTERNADWLNGLTKAGIPIAFVSNGYRERVEEYNEDLGFYFSFQSGKRGFLKAAQALGLPPNQIAVIGDQIYTDIWGGNRAGMFTCLVEPIEPEPWLRFRLKRALERPIVKRLGYTKEETP